MSLRVITRRDTGTLWITGTVHPAGAAQGIRVRRRAGSDREESAREEARLLEVQILRDYHLGARPAVRNFAQAAASYLTHEPRSVGTELLVDRLLAHFGNQPLSTITQEAVDRARSAILRAGVTPSTVKRNLIAPLRAILKHAQRRGWCVCPEFDLPRESKGRTAFFFPEQVEVLIAKAAPHLRPLIVFLVGTGCRVSEALGLDWKEVDLAAARVLLWEGETKSGQRRIVDLPPAVIAALASMRHRAGRVFLTRRGLPYGGVDGTGTLALRSSWAVASSKAGMPGISRNYSRTDRPSHVDRFVPEYSPHVLRHTWATWHYAINRDLMLLTRDAGWSTVRLAERYAKLMPTGHEDAIRRVWGWHVSDTQLTRHSA